MLKLLRINNIAIIPSLEMEFGPGLTLLTGETGAGKSILIDALGLLLGARASADLVRTGEELGVVEALLESAEAGRLLEAHGIPRDGDEIILRREVHVSGRGKATVNGSLVPVGLLRELAPTLAAIHGQHEPQGLLDPEIHLDLLDHHGGLKDEAERVAQFFRRLREIEAALATLRRSRQEVESRREMLEFQAGEIERAHLSPGDEEELRREKLIQVHAERLASLAREAYGLLYEDEGAVVARLGQVYKRLEELATIDRHVGPLLEARTELMARVEDLALFLRDYREAVQVSPGRLDEIESRLALIERLKRKYGATVEEVLALAESCRAKLAETGPSEERERALDQEEAALSGAYLSAARELSRRRRGAAEDLEKRVEAELALLAMEKARFRVAFQPDNPGGESPESWTDRGLEGVEFLISANPGEDLRPLARVASGGELSRLLLALESVATLDARGKTLVFDEVDAGIGGRVAEIVGRKLKDVAARHQVLCVTHLPQIASLADTHYVVRKRVERGRTLTEVQALGDAERVEEVARMLGGETVTDAARHHAREMVRQGLRA